MIVGPSGRLGRLILEHGRAVDTHDLRLDGECARARSQCLSLFLVSTGNAERNCRYEYILNVQPYGCSREKGSMLAGKHDESSGWMR